MKIDEIIAVIESYIDDSYRYVFLYEDQYYNVKNVKYFLLHNIISAYANITGVIPFFNDKNTREFISFNLSEKCISFNLNKFDTLNLYNTVLNNFDVHMNESLYDTNLSNNEVNLSLIRHLYGLIFKTYLIDKIDSPLFLNYLNIKELNFTELCLFNIKIDGANEYLLPIKKKSLFYADKLSLITSSYPLDHNKLTTVKQPKANDSQLIINNKMEKIYETICNSI
ncbi:MULTISPECIES: hypothetical protein [Cysteiniphilum]|uniref:Uncharacterized protein n=1 Tax=Cysteiniphilum litorale TaxID=2056700 RepID=A0A8J3E867_9GAMM|nr:MULTISPECIES: hypothetical protein [Cysteiniphilum]GGF91504.1 hypothetical protein GCM10010995_05910 [Cysteiniphilum litorale]